MKKMVEKYSFLVSEILINWEPVDLKNYLPASLSGMMVYCNPPFWLPSANGPFEVGQSFENKTPFTPGWRSSNRNFSLINQRQKLSGFFQMSWCPSIFPCPTWNGPNVWTLELERIFDVEKLSEIKDEIHLKCALFVCVSCILGTTMLISMKNWRAGVGDILPKC